MADTGALKRAKAREAMYEPAKRIADTLDDIAMALEQIERHLADLSQQRI